MSRGGRTVSICCTGRSGKSSMLMPSFSLLMYFIHLSQRIKSSFRPFRTELPFPTSLLDCLKRQIDKAGGSIAEEVHKVSFLRINSPTVVDDSSDAQISEKCAMGAVCTCKLHYKVYGHDSILCLAFNFS